ncbi:MAG: D-alanine--D-alanine ligase [Crocinitomicaceae bacterium]|nr:D-alanine--D-alanine ligase [Crocinitomicaceae bacterium]
MKRLGIICGGFSSEYEISLKSARTIIDNFPEGFDVFSIVLNETGWKANYHGEEYDFDIRTMSFNATDTVKNDAAIVYVHGDPGENGKIQALLEIQQIPYVNSGPLASSLSFDKWYCNQFLKGFNIPVAKSLFLRSIAEFSNQEIIETLGLPLFVKPSDSGSSYGISKVKSEAELTEALKLAFKEGRTVVVESFLDGVEVTCGVYRKKEGIHALPLTEIASENEFFDYEAKYQGKSQEITPARVEDSIRDKVQETAKFVYDLLQLRSIARIDFMIVNNVPYVIEVNTTPGFSPASIVPQMIKCEGGTIQQFWTDILAVELV